MDIFIKQDMFHQIMLKKYFVAPIVKEEQTIRRFLCYYQELACKAYPTEAKMNSILGDLYDAKFHVYLTTFGSYSVFVYSLCAVDPSYIDDENYTLNRLEEEFELFLEAKMNSATANKALFERAYEIFESDLLSLKENLQSISVENTLLHYFKGTTREYSRFGTFEDLEKITPKKLFLYYQKLKNEETISIGTGRLSFKENPQAITLTPKRNYLFKDRGNPPHSLSEPSKSKQCYLNVIYETNTFSDDRLFSACAFLNHILGEGGSSYLFRKVREKYGLCYAISSSYMGASGIILISCVLDPKNVKKGIEAIEEAVEEIEKLEFDLEEIRNVFISKTRLMEDYLDTAIENYFMDTYFLDTPKSSQAIKGYQNVTMKDILEVYKRLKKSFVYVLGGKVHAEK
ncbi:MAG: insulinase family protein [Anaeroplasmataceae bacterium]|nr:insulinase family protein [Anaeroplasmataceae bacterium]